MQFNWIPLPQSADVMDLLAEVEMHGIQTSGNCIRNITTDQFAGVAADELIDPRPCAEILRQWSTLHPEFAFLPRKFKIAISGAAEDRAAIGWHDIGLQLRRNDAGEVGFQVLVGGGLGRTPIIGQVINPFLPWQHILLYLEAIVRVYNRYGRRDNKYKARIKILVKAEGQAYFDAVNAEYLAILSDDAGSHEQIIPEAELARVAASFVEPQGVAPVPGIDIFEGASPAYRRWLERNVARAPRRRLPLGDAVAQARGPAAGRHHRRADGRRRGAVRPLQPRRAARLARPEPAAAVGARERPAGAVRGRQGRDASPRPTSAC